MTQKTLFPPFSSDLQIFEVPYRRLAVLCRIADTRMSGALNICKSLAEGGNNVFCVIYAQGGLGI